MYDHSSNIAILNLIIDLVIGFILTWGIGLSWPSLVRFLIVRKPLSRKWSCILTVAFWLLDVLIFTALGSQGINIFASFLVAWISYHIMHKGYRYDNPIKKKDEYPDEKERALDVQKQLVGKNRQSDLTEQARTSKEPSPEELIRKRILHNDRHAKWAAFAFLLFICVGVIVVHFSNSPKATQADSIDTWIVGPPEGSLGFRPFIRRRNLSTPSGRLVGHWIGVPNGGRLYYQPIDHSLGYGNYIWKIQSDILCRLKILSEESSGDYLKTREFLTFDGKPDYVIAEYCIPKDGQSMTKEIISDGGSRYLFKYHYVDGYTTP